MNPARIKFSHSRLLSAALLGAVALFLLPGCKGNPTSAASPGKHVGSPPTIAAHRATVDPRNADPLTSEIWQKAAWTTFSSPANSTRTTAPSRGAVLFSPTTLYVAFINARQSAASPSSRDLCTLYLDTTAERVGKEMMKISVDSTGKASCTWLRMASPALPREDGSPNLGHTVTMIPDQVVAGLGVTIGQGTLDGVPVWTAVLSVPLTQLPKPLVTSASAGAHWKFNLLRSVVTDWGTPQAEQLQANLSPVHVGAQEYAPYRMADLVLVQ